MLGTGQRFVGDYTDNEQQYLGLMKTGVTFAQKFHLNVGSELTADQMAALTTDLVWLVEKTVTLPDGSTQRVLVPQVYLMSRVGDLKGDGALISANNTSIHTQGDVVNTGTISSRNVTLIDAQNIHNNGGTLNGGTLALNAQEDINSLAGKISGNAVLAYAGRDINLSSTTASGTGKAGSSNTVLAGVSSVNADTATLVAGRDLNAKAASLQTTGDLAMGAGRDVNLGTVAVAQTEHYEHDAKNKSDLSRSTEIGSQVSAGNTTIEAGRDVNATAAYVNAEGAMAVGAGRDINVHAGQASASVRDEHFTQSNGFLSSSSTHSIDAKSHTEALGSTLSGNTVDMKAGRDMTIAGSTIAGTGDVNLGAGHNLTVTTAETNSSGYSFKEEKKSGFGATGSGLSYGNRDQKDTTNDRGTQQVGSLVGSTDGSVHMQAGSTLTVKGSDLIARQDVTGVGADVNIEAAQNRQHHDETHEVKQSGFTLGVSGGAIGAAINAGNKISSASKSEDGRASALWSMAAARDVADAAQGMANPTQGAAVTLSWGTSQSKQTLTQDSTSHNGSRVQAGGTAAFVATGVDANGNQTAGNQKQDLATLKRDTTGTNSQVGNNPDLEKLLNKQADMMAAAQAAGEALAKTVGDIAKAKLDDANKRYAVAAEANKQNPSAENQAAMEAAQADIDGWKDGGSYRAALHTAGGALIAGLGGGNALAGAAGAGAASLAGGKLGELSNAVAGGADTGNAALNETLGNIAANIVAGGIGAVVGGGSGAATAANVDRYNRQLHQSEYDYARKNAKVVAQKLGISEQDAEGRIAAEILRNSDKQTADSAGGKHDYEVRSVLGCQNLNCDGYKSDPNYADHNYNSQYIAGNQATYNREQTQLGKGQTYNELVTSNIKKDPVGATLAGAGMIGFGLATAGGIPSLAGMFTGGSIGAVVNTGAQYVFNDGKINYIDTSLAGVTGAITFGTSFIPNLLINTGGALTGSAIKGENPNIGMAGAAAGTAVGYAAGGKLEKVLGEKINPWYRSEWTDLGLGVTKYAPQSPLPSIGGTTFGAVGSEGTNGTVGKVMSPPSTTPTKK